MSLPVPRSKPDATNSSLLTAIPGLAIPGLKSSEADSIAMNNYYKMKPVLMIEETQGSMETYSGLGVREVLSGMWFVKQGRVSRNGYFIMEIMSKAGGRVYEGW